MYPLTKVLIRTIFILLLTCSYFASIAQTKQVLQFDAITIDDGLSQGMINCIMRDSYGFMWFATKDGLNRYDGYEFVVYKHDISDSNSICDNMVTYIFEDRQRRLWVGTGSGLSIFSRNTERFTNLTPKINSQLTCANGLVTSIGQDIYGDIWVATYNGLTQWHETITNGQSNFLSTCYFKNEVNLHIDSKSQIWVSVLSDALYQIVPRKNNKPVINKLPRSFFGDSLKVSNKRPVNIFVEDTLNQKLYFLYRQGITQLDLNSGKRNYLKSPMVTYGNFERQAYIDKTEQIWYVESNVLLKYNVPQQIITNITASDSHKQQSLQNTSNVYCDNSGLIWIGTKGYGILKYHPRIEQFNFIAAGSMGFMSAAPGNKVVITKAFSFLSTFNIAGKKIETIPDSTFINEVDFKNFGISTSAVFEDTNIVWLSKGKLTKIDLRTKKVKQYNNGSVENFPVFLSDSMVYIGTPHSFSVFNPRTETFTNYPYPVKISQMPYNFLQHIYRAPNGIFWLATAQGLFALDIVKNKWQHYHNQKGNLQSLSVDMVYSICADAVHPEKYLWLGTNGGGLNKFDIETGQCKIFNTKNGLPNDVVYGILSDENNNLWLSTNLGLACFNPNSGLFNNYQAKDGLQSNEFNRFAYCKTADGCLFFGGINGLNYFYPAQIKPLKTQPQLLITAIYINNKKPLSFHKSLILSSPAYLTNEVKLTPDNNIITFEFATTDYIASTKNKYQYKLDGFDKDWVQSGSVRLATYTNLDPGTYTFTVKGTNIDGIWSATSQTVTIKILAPWYSTWWFAAIVVSIVAALGFFLYKFRFYRALEIANVRNRIARDLHDEVGSNLSSITIYNDVAMQKNKQTEVEPLLQKMGFYAQSSLEAMNDIVWMITTNNDKFENIFARMREHAVNLLDEKCILHINFDEKLYAEKLQMDERRNFYLIYKEALNNILKYAKCQNVWIELKLLNTLVLLRIKDDGIGFEMTDKELSKVLSSNGGNGLINMQNRAALLQGELTLKSAPGQGTVMVLMFQLKHSW